MKTRSDFEEIFSELAVINTIQTQEVREIFLKTLKEIFNEDNIIEMEKKETNNYGFYIYKNSKFKKISFSQRIKALLKDKFTNNINIYKNSLIKQKVKQLKQSKELIKGEIIKINKTNVLVKTAFTICKAPKKLLRTEDLIDIAVGVKHLFKIYKYSFTAGIVNIILTRNHIDIDKYYIKLILKDYEIKNVKKYPGVVIKIYINKLPKKSEINDLKLFFKNENIKFFGYQKKGTSNAA